MTVESVDMPLLKILYQPLPMARRMWANTVAEGVVYPVAIGVAGLGLTLLTGVAGFGPRELLWAFCLLLAAWIAVAVLLGRGYLTALLNALTRRRLGAVTLLIDDASSIGVLRQALGSPNPGSVIYALDMLQENQPEILTGALPGLLSHPAPEVREEALLRIERYGLVAALPAVRALVEEEALPGVRAAAFRTLIALDGTAEAAWVAARLEDPDPDVAGGAAVALLCHGSGDAYEQAHRMMAGLASSPDPAARVRASRMLARVNRCADAQVLGNLVGDPDAGVRRERWPQPARPGSPSCGRWWSTAWAPRDREPRPPRRLSRQATRPCPPWQPHSPNPASRARSCSV